MRLYERKYRRIDLQLGVEITTEAGIRLDARSENISLGGVKIICNQLVANTLMPSGYQLLPDQSLIISLDIALGANEMVKVRCRVVNFRRQSQDVFGLNIQFNSFDDSSEEMLERFIKINTQ